MKVADYDKNFASKRISEKIKNNTVYYDSEEAPIKIYGLPNGYASAKLPKDLEVNEVLRIMSGCTSGGRLRFKTDSPYIILRVALPYVFYSTTTPVTCTPGGDVYIKEGNSYTFGGVFIPPENLSEVEEKGGYESIVSFPDSKMRDVTINMPTYNAVDKMWVGIEKGKKIEAADEYTRTTPMVFYGSSITQGGSASRPGCMYPTMLARKYDSDLINFGFSGSAQGEDNVADYIASFDMSVFVYDYDYNAPTPEHLEKTHEKMFKKIRAKHPDIPIIIASKPKSSIVEEDNIRRRIIKKTYNNALKSGDKNVYFVDGRKMFKKFGGDDFCTVDRTHPNDLGFYAMAVAFDKVLQKIFGESLILCKPQIELQNDNII